MKEIYGKRVYTTLNEMVDPKHTTLILVNMQNDWCHPDGHFGKHGVDLSMIRAMIPKLADFVGQARSRSVPVVFIQDTTDRAGQSDSPAWLYFRTKGRKYAPVPPEFAIEDTWGHNFIAELQPLPNEVTIKKHRSSAFINTDLDLVLRSNGIGTVIITGTVTQGSVESTARSASFHDYYVVLASDLIQSVNQELHEAAMLVLSSRYDTAASDEIIAEWKRYTTKSKSAVTG